MTESISTQTDEPKEEANKIFFNRPQLLSYLIDANEEYDVWGRGTGKTSINHAWGLRRDVINMPRSKTGFVACTYQQMLTRTLPALTGGLEKFGLVKDKHYWIGHKPPKNLKVPDPYEGVTSHKYFIHFINGSGVHLISQDIDGSSNGLNLDALRGDESKYMNYYQFLEETFPAMRANRDKFGHLHYHWGVNFSTSMPTNAESRWILRKEDEMNKDLINYILQIEWKCQELREEMVKAKKTKKQKLQKRINKIQKHLAPYRKKAVYFSEHSTLENLAILGEEYIRKMRRTMYDSVFNTEILNIRPKQIENGFYPGLDLQYHGYIAYNNNYLENLGYDFDKIQNIDCRQDADIVQNKPLCISVDWGSRINCLTVAQDLRIEFRILNDMHVKPPHILDDLAKQFCDYYRFHERKEVLFAYDHTGNKREANSKLTYAQQFERILHNKGWKVRKITSKKQPPTHEQKFLLVNKLLREEEPMMPRITFNKHNTANLVTSMSDAPAIEGSKGEIKKSKASEKKDDIPQEEATHLSDTFDNLIWQFLKENLKGRHEFIDTMAT